MVTLRSYLIWQIISFLLPPNENGCVYAWTTLGNIATLRFWQKKNHLFRWSAFSLRVCKQTKLSHLGHRKPARIHWKADALKTRYCDRLTEDDDFGQKKIIFSDEAHFSLGGYVNKQNWRIWGTENRTHTLKSRRPQNVSLFGADFCPEA